MNESVTVDQALARGKRLINLPVLVIIFGIIGFSLYLTTLKLYPNWIVLTFGPALSLLLSWVYWSFMITRWRIWAFKNVRNVHELKKRAIEDKLIWPDDSIFVKSEIRTKQDRERLHILASKFKLEDEFLDDLSVPNETVIFYDKASNLFEMALMLGGMGLGIYLLLETESYIMGSVVLIFSAYTAFKEYKEATNKTPQIILNEHGLQTVSAKFHEWKDIIDERAITESYGKNSEDYLVYHHPSGYERLSIDDYNTNRDALNKLLRIYRWRNKKIKRSRQL